MTGIKAEFDTREVGKLAADIEKAPVSSLRRLQRVVDHDASELTDLAKANARRSAGKHGKWYPGSIGYDLTDGDLTAVIGPDVNDPKGQGGMSFEYGSRNQKPHLDLNRAMDVIGPKFERDVIDAAEVDL